MEKQIAAACVLLAASCTSANAEVIDIATVKCSELGTMSQEDASFLFAWIHGYYGGKVGDTTMNLEAMAPAGEAIGQYCGENPEVGIMTAVTQVFGQ